jgi:hypothetical protein
MFRSSKRSLRNIEQDERQQHELYKGYIEVLMGAAFGEGALMDGNDIRIQGSVKGVSFTVSGKCGDVAFISPVAAVDAAKNDVFLCFELKKGEKTSSCVYSITL